MARVSIMLFLFCLYRESLAQPVKVEGGFLMESVRVGEPCPYYLTTLAPPHLQIVHPDSTQTFSTFEFVKRQAFPTATVAGRSFDSTIYWLRTFELDSIQTLQLSARAILSGDTLVYSALADSILVQHLVIEPPDPAVPPSQLELKSHTLYERVRMLFNYPLFLIIVGSLAALVALLVVVFYRRIQRAIRKWKLGRDYRRFYDLFTDRIDRVRSKPTVDEAERVLTCWKQYMERLEDKPFLKLTTKEIQETTGDSNLMQWLQQIDRSLYGGAAVSPDLFEPLGQYAKTANQRRIEELSYG